MDHYIDVIMTTIASQITSLTVVYSIVYSDPDQRKLQSSASLAFVWGIHRDRWIPRTKGQLRGKCFHLMTSSWWLSARLVTPLLTHWSYCSLVLNHWCMSVNIVPHDELGPAYLKIFQVCFQVNKTMSNNGFQHVIFSNKAPWCHLNANMLS